MDTDIKSRAYQLLRRHQVITEDDFDEFFRVRDGKVRGRVSAHDPLIEIDVEAGTITFDDFPDGKFTIAV